MWTLLKTSVWVQYSSDTNRGPTCRTGTNQRNGLLHCFPLKFAYAINFKKVWLTMPLLWWSDSNLVHNCWDTIVEKEHYSCLVKTGYLSQRSCFCYCLSSNIYHFIWINAVVYYRIYFISYNVCDILFRTNIPNSVLFYFLGLRSH